MSYPMCSVVGNAMSIYAAGAGSYTAIGAYAGAISPLPALTVPLTLAGVAADASAKWAAQPEADRIVEAACNAAAEGIVIVTSAISDQFAVVEQVDNAVAAEIYGLKDDEGEPEYDAKDFGEQVIDVNNEVGMESGGMDLGGMEPEGVDSGIMESGAVESEGMESGNLESGRSEESNEMYCGGEELGGMDSGGMDSGGMDSGGMDSGGMDSGGMESESTNPSSNADNFDSSVGGCSNCTD